MNKKSALIIAAAFTILFFVNFYFLKTIHRDSARESATIARVIDGDTIQLDDGRIIRLLNINAPEKNTKSSILAKNFVELFKNKTIELEIIGKDKYLRHLARIYAPDYLNLELVKQGFASKFLVDSSELKKFEEAESEAIKESLGIWNKSDFFGCITAKVNQKSEFVVLKNICPNLNLNNWRVKDESRKVYVFKNISFNEITLHSKNGKDNQTDIFWNSKQDIWNNDRDSFYLFDNKEKIASYETYGY